MRSTINLILAILTGAITAIIGLIFDVVSYALNKRKKEQKK
jgi:hypothetical protein